MLIINLTNIYYLYFFIRHSGDEGTDKSNNSIIDEIDAEVSSHDSGITDADGDDNEDRIFTDDISSNNVKNVIPWRMPYTSNENNKKDTIVNEESVGDVNDNAALDITDKQAKKEDFETSVEVKNDVQKTATVAVLQSTINNEKKLGIDDKATNQHDKKSHKELDKAISVQEQQPQNSKISKKKKKLAGRKDVSHKQKRKFAVEVTENVEKVSPDSTEHIDKVNKDRQKLVPLSSNKGKNVSGSETSRNVSNEFDNTFSSQANDSSNSFDKNISQLKKDIEISTDEANIKKSNINASYISKSTSNNKVNNKPINMDKPSLDRDGKSVKKGQAVSATSNYPVNNVKKIQREVKPKSVSGKLRESSVSPTSKLQSIDSNNTKPIANTGNVLEPHTSLASRDRYEINSSRKSEFTPADYFVSSTGNSGNVNLRMSRLLLM